MNDFRYAGRVALVTHKPEFDKSISIAAKQTCKAIELLIRADEFKAPESDDFHSVCERDNGVNHDSTYITILGGLGYAPAYDSAFLYLSKAIVLLAERDLLQARLVLETPSLELLPINQKDGTQTRTSKNGRCLYRLEEPTRFVACSYPTAVSAPPRFPVATGRKTRRRSSAGQLRVIPTATPGNGRWF